MTNSLRRSRDSNLMTKHINIKLQIYKGEACGRLTEGSGKRFLKEVTLTLKSKVVINNSEQRPGVGKQG